MATKKEVGKVDAVALLDSLDETGINGRIEHLERELEALRVLAKAVDIRRNGKPERKKREPKPAAKPKTATSTAISNGDATLAKVVKYLEHAGAASLGAIAQSVGSHHLTVRSILLSDPRFEETRAGWRIRPDDEDDD